MKLFKQLTEDTTLITPNRRLSATLLKKYNYFQIESGKSCWPTLDILPFQSWLQRMWYELTSLDNEASPILLNLQQEQVLWEKILKKTIPEESLLLLAETAELVRSAWGLVQQWQIALTHPELITTENSRAFLNWVKEFHSLEKKENYLDNFQLSDVIAEKIIQKKLALPKKIILVGFTELSPQQKHLFIFCEKIGTQVSHYLPDSSFAITQRIALDDEKTEIETMARWAKNLLKQSYEKNITIGCVVPHLERSRDTVSRIFSEIFSDAGCYTLDPITLPFNISAGKSLASYPILVTALQLLHWQGAPLPIETFSILLHSPFLSKAEQERNQRAKFDILLRKDNLCFVSLEDLERLHFKSYCPDLALRIKKICIRSGSYSFTQWAAFFIEQLTLLGWPGERSVNSTEYQVIQEWLDQLSTYQTLDRVLPPQTHQEALRYLTQIMNKALFQPQTPEAPVQILGLLEAAALPFDYLWIMGLDDTSWPSAATPNPFLPHRLQKTQKMPHASAERELEYSKILMQQFQTSAKQVIMSHSTKNKAGELRPSTLICDFPEITLEGLKLSEIILPANYIFQSHAIETYCDETAPAILPHEKIKGSTRIFKAQAACPFKAFAEIRLGADTIHKPTLGLQAKERGILVHKALELIWKELKNSSALHALNETELKQFIHTQAETALHHSTKKEIKKTRYLQLELHRLKNLLWKWLQFEKSRPTFKVKFCEKEVKTLLRHIPLTLRIDRIDELEDGSQWIIDYKTSKEIKSDDWMGNRPDEPQLPLYCITAGSSVSAVLFAQINAKKSQFIGASEKKTPIKSIKIISWEKTLKEWKFTLEKIEEDFYQGQAKIDPKKITDTCNHCHLTSLCRVYESFI